MPIQPTTNPASGLCASRRVLIVEDDPRVRSALSELLAASDGLCVGGLAATASAAAAAAERAVLDVALVDVLLPDLQDGLSVIRALVADGHQVVALSASAAVREASLAAGASTFVEKDSHPDALLTALSGSSSVDGCGDSHDHG